MFGLYLHIPFCTSICNYCNFNRGLFDRGLKERYVQALVKEIRQAGRAQAADTIYFGGGTPSLLEPEEVAALISACKGSFSVAADAEITLETNPETVTTERLERFRAAGVNRISFGVQSFREAELRRLGRLHSAERARSAVFEARRAGFLNVSLDLMMWLPEQSLADWRESVEQLIDAAPAHASLYLLELYPNAPLKEEMARSGWSVAPDGDAAEMYLWSMDRLERAGYRQYEISNVAQPGYQSRHNLKYWRDGEWFGFGCGAHSTIGGTRWKNISSTVDYIDRVSAGASLPTERRQLSGDEHLEEALFMGLRLSEGVDLVAAGARYGIDAWDRFGEQLQPFVDTGLLRRDGSRLRLTREGMLVSNEIMAVFV
jgi:oxygen-independent coproporphyrinogen-3 oxidase